MNKKIKLFSKIIVLIELLIFPIMTSAASLGLVLPTDKITVNDIAIAELRLVTGEEQINAIDGEIQFDTNALNVQEISTGGSVFSIWTRQPVFSNQSGKIIFAGGTPNGIKHDGTVFKIIFIAKKEGLASFTVASSTTLYLNDGLGTIIRPILSKGELAVQATSSTASINSWQQELNNDKIGPVDLFLTLGRDTTAFDGKYFLTITATDQQSGLDHFEVKEGDRGFVRSESPYIFKDQSLRSKVFVIAVDKAGNATLARFESPNVQKNYHPSLYVWIAVSLLLLVLLAVAMFIKIKNKNVSRPSKK